MAKKYKKNAALVNPETFYTVEQAFSVLDGFEKTKFDETVDVAVRLGVDPRQADQNVRGAVNLPNGLGKKVRVLAFVKGDKEAEAKEAGADFVGSDDLIEQISKGWTDFDSVVATPDMMGTVSKVGRILGPRGLMPNPKLGTVTFEVGRAVREAKAGKVEFRVEKAGIVHAPIGKRSFGAEKLKENFTFFIDAISKAKPATSKGTYIKSVTVSSTMSPGIHLDVATLIK